MNSKQIFENNKNWVTSKLAEDENYFENLAKNHTPEILYIGCSDSRVPAEYLMGIEPGEVFVHRNIANMVSDKDLNVMSVLNYAVDYLKINHIVVCGHYYCGGVKAAMEKSDFGDLNPWLKKIQNVYKIHKEELNAITSEEIKYKRLIELNVQEQCKNIINTKVVQKALTKRNIKVHGWVFDIKTGKLKNINA